MEILFRISIFLMITLFPIMAVAEEKEGCRVQDKLCVMADIEAIAATIEKASWRDKTYRELAKTYTYEGHEDKAIALIDKIETPDTQAMTIRGIGMAAADNKWRDQSRYDALFKELTTAAETIEHPPSHAIAYTYIAMAQAFAGDNAGAMATAKKMDNQALRNKAYAETAEIQAERGDYDNAIRSIAQIDSLAFRNKAYSIIANIFTKSGDLNKAYAAAQQIDNAYMKAQAFQKIMNYGNKEEAFGKE